MMSVPLFSIMIWSKSIDRRVHLRYFGVKFHEKDYSNHSITLLFQIMELPM